MFLFTDSEQVYFSFVSVSTEGVDESDICVVEVELSDLNQSLRANPALGIAVALNKVHHRPTAPIILVAEKEYDELEGWRELRSNKNVFFCQKPVDKEKAEAAFKEALQSG